MLLGRGTDGRDRSSFQEEERKRKRKKGRDEIRKGRKEKDDDELIRLVISIFEWNFATFACNYAVKI